MAAVAHARTDRQPAAGLPAAGLPAVGLEVEALRHAYGERTVLREVDLSLAPGEVHCLVGPSGCGKTTMLRLIAGLEPVQSGRIVIDGEVVAEPGYASAPEARRVGLMFQDFALFPHLRVLDNVAFGLRGLDHRARRRRALELLAQVELDAHADSYPHMLSGGEQQRVALARALAPKPRLMLLDEPFSSLDAMLRAHVRDDAIALLRTAGTPVLMVTHDADEAVRVADRIHVMQDGRMLQHGTPAELYAHPANPFVAGFFGPLNRYKGWVVGGAGQHAARAARGRRPGRRHAGRRADPARGPAAAPRWRRGSPKLPGAANSRSRHQPRPGARAARRAAGDRAHDQHRRVHGGRRGCRRGRPAPDLCLSRAAAALAVRVAWGRVFCDTSYQARDPEVRRARRDRCERSPSMSIGIWQVVLILAIVLILFGAGKLPKVMGDVAKGVKSFKAGMKDDDEDDKRVALTTEAADEQVRARVAEPGLKRDEVAKG